MMNDPFDRDQLARARRRHQEVGVDGFAARLLWAGELEGEARELLEQGVGPRGRGR